MLLWRRQGPQAVTFLDDITTFIVGRVSSVGMATRYGLDGSGIEFRWGARFFATVQNSRAAYPVPYSMGTESFFFLLALQPPLWVVFYSPLAGFSLLAYEVS